MGCKLPKLRKAEERQSPGNIYSTLRRPQVETKVGVAYTYHFLDFLLGKEGMGMTSNWELLCAVSTLKRGVFSPLRDVRLLSGAVASSVFDLCLC